MTNHWDIYDAGTVSVIDLKTKKITATIDVGNEPEGIAVSPDGKKIYVADFGTFYYTDPGNLSVIDTTTNKVIATLV